MTKTTVPATAVTLGPGYYFDFSAIDEQEYRLPELAVILCRLPRYNSVLRDPYTVGNHSLLLSYCVPLEHAIEALLHDLHEAIVGDMTGPLKRFCPDFRTIERRVELALRRAFGVPEVMTPVVKEADRRIACNEKLQILGRGRHEEWEYLDGLEPLPFELVHLPPEICFDMFMRRHETLLKGLDIPLESLWAYKRGMLWR